MKYLGYVSLAIFTFVIGIAISPIRFYGESISCGFGNSSSSYRSSYFMQTTSSYVNYKTEEAAIDVFNAELSQAVQVYESSSHAVYKDGVLIDQRAVYLLYHPGNDEYYVEVMWREGKTLHYIHSRSYSHVKEFERQYFQSN